MLQIGAQLYTVREFCQDEVSLGHTLEKVSSIGYRYVQLSALGPVAPHAVRRMCDDNGLGIVLTHNPFERFINDTSALIEEHQLYGCRYAGLGSMPDKYRSEEGVYRFTDDIYPALEKLKAAGMIFMYHNHALEFEKTADGCTLMDILLSRIPGELMGITADTYWLQFAGLDVSAWLREHADRLYCVHFKDMIPVGFENRMAAVGQGNMDLKGMMDLLVSAGCTEYVLAEQDHCYGQDPFFCLEQSFRAMQNMLK